jgi:hypothetical protein
VRTLSSLPCWSGLDAMAHRRKVGELIDAIAERRRAEGMPSVLGRRAILSQHPHDKPLACDRSPAPAVHTASKPIRLMLRIAYWRFVAVLPRSSLSASSWRPLDRLPSRCFPAAAALRRAHRVVRPSSLLRLRATT